MEWYNWIRKYSEQSVNGILLISLMHGDISEQLNFKVIHMDLVQFEQQKRGHIFNFKQFPCLFVVALSY